MLIICFNYNIDEMRRTHDVCMIILCATDEKNTNATHYYILQYRSRFINHVHLEWIAVALRTRIRSRKSTTKSATESILSTILFTSKSRLKILVEFVNFISNLHSIATSVRTGQRPEPQKRGQFFFFYHYFTDKSKIKIQTIQTNNSKCQIWNALREHTVV